MNKLISFTGGKPDFNIDDMLWNDEATRDALNDVFRAFGDNYIIYGVTGSNSITAGYVMLDGELLKVDAHAKTGTHFEKVTTYDSGGDATFNDGVARQTWQQNRATITAGSGSLAYSGAKRLSDIDSDPVEVVLIGDWDMDTEGLKDVTHGLTDHKKVRNISVIVRDDADTNYYKLERTAPSGAVAGGVSLINATIITLTRQSGGSFDGTNFDSTGYNRGWIKFELES